MINELNVLHKEPFAWFVWMTAFGNIVEKSKMKGWRSSMATGNSSSDLEQQNVIMDLLGKTLSALPPSLDVSQHHTQVSHSILLHASMSLHEDKSPLNRL